MYNNRQNTAKHITHFHPNVLFHDIHSKIIKFKLDVFTAPVEPQNSDMINNSEENSSFFIQNTDESFISVKGVVFANLNFSNVSQEQSKKNKRKVFIFSINCDIYSIFWKYS
jgi:hypothetical protein